MARCDTTGKIIHADEQSARHAIAALYRAGLGNPHYRPYRCGDHWHVGHSQASLAHAIRNAIRAGNTASGINRRTRKRK